MIRLELVLAPILAVAVLAATPAAAQRFGDPAAAFDNADADRDGVITRGEFAAARMARFSQMDRNHDGAVSKADFKRIARFRPEAAARLDMLIAEADANHDGKATHAEMAAAPMPIFDRADANRDNRVDKAERAAITAAMKARR
jgi:hypothetical protein